MAENGTDIILEHSTDSGATWTRIAGLLSDDIAFTNGRIECKTKEDGPDMVALDDVSEKSAVISGNGITKSTVLLSLYHDADEGTATADFRLTLGARATITGEWFLDSYNETGADKEAATFSYSLSSTGATTLAIL